MFLVTASLTGPNRREYAIVSPLYWSNVTMGTISNRLLGGGLADGRKAEAISSYACCLESGKTSELNPTGSSEIQKSGSKTRPSRANRSIHTLLFLKVAETWDEENRGEGTPLEGGSQSCASAGSMAEGVWVEE